MRGVDDKANECPVNVFISDDEMTRALTYLTTCAGGFYKDRLNTFHFFCFFDFCL